MSLLSQCGGEEEENSHFDLEHITFAASGQIWKGCLHTAAGHTFFLPLLSCVLRLQLVVFSLIDLWNF